MVRLNAISLRAVGSPLVQLRFAPTITPRGHMFLGHYGLALAAKRVAPRTSLSALTFAAQFCDELWPILLLFGVEHVKIVPGLMAANPLDFTYYSFSHSLLMTIVWGGLIGGVSYLLSRYGRGAWVLAILVASHWFLDLVVHRPDLPL